MFCSIHKISCENIGLIHSPPGPAGWVWSIHFDELMAFYPDFNWETAGHINECTQDCDSELKRQILGRKLSVFWDSEENTRSSLAMFCSKNLPVCHSHVPRIHSKSFIDFCNLPTKF